MGERMKLLRLALKACHAGHKYQLAVKASIDSLEAGQVDTPGNAGLIERYWQEWNSACEEALLLQKRLEGGAA